MLSSGGSLARGPLRGTRYPGGGHADCGSFSLAWLPRAPAATATTPLQRSSTTETKLAVKTPVVLARNHFTERCPSDVHCHPDALTGKEALPTHNERLALEQVGAQGTRFGLSSQHRRRPQRRAEPEKDPHGDQLASTRIIRR